MSVTDTPVSPHVRQLLDPVQVSPPRLTQIKRLTGRDEPTNFDLLCLLPIDAQPRLRVSRVADLGPSMEGSSVAVPLIADAHIPATRSDGPIFVRCRDKEGDRLLLTFFHTTMESVQSRLPLGALRIAKGKLSFRDGWARLANPAIVTADEDSRISAWEAIRPLTEGMSTAVLQRTIVSALVGCIDELEAIGWKAPLAALHMPNSAEGAAVDGPARRALAFDELLCGQLAGLLEARKRQRTSAPLPAGGALRTLLYNVLPYRLTDWQRQAVEEILADVRGPRIMRRLLQGDVGSGKTVCALLVAADVVEAGGLVILLAPTTVLAEQHARTILPLANQVGLKVVGTLTGSSSTLEREAMRTYLAAGDAGLLIATHAALEEGMSFPRLRLLIVDEEHRWGTLQRQQLLRTGADYLALSATPIPRTLALARAGDIEVSSLEGRPPGRLAVRTSGHPTSRIGDVVIAAEKIIAGGGTVFWLCPSIDVVDGAPTTSVLERFEAFRSRFGDRCELLHGRLVDTARDRTLERVRSGATRILISTTIIEVGVDIGSANMMVVENAERFGLATLHQLRGRVGRRGQQAYCILIYSSPLSDIALSRLNIMRAIDSGFELARYDLLLRNEGDLLGERQSGTPSHRFVSLPDHEDLILKARAEAEELLATDPELTSARGATLRTMMRLFDRSA
jgi:ATP-dependent DNA helicase RecG